MNDWRDELTDHLNRVERDTYQRLKDAGVPRKERRAQTRKAVKLALKAAKAAHRSDGGD